MRIPILLIFSFLGFLVNDLSAQRKNKKDYLKNSFDIYYSGNLSKTKLRRTDVPSSGWMNTLAQLEDKTNPVYGFNYGLGYNRRISKRTSLGLGFGYEEKGEISDPISIINPNNPNSNNVLTLYKYTLESYRIPITLSINSFNFKLLGKELTSFFGGNVVTDIYLKFIAQNHLRFIDSGEQREGGVTEMLLFYENNWVGLKNHLSKGYVRIGLGAFSGLNMNLGERFFIRTSLNYLYYTGPIKKHDFLIKGPAWVLGLKMSTGIKF